MKDNLLATITFSKNPHTNSRVPFCASTPSNCLGHAIWGINSRAFCIGPDNTVGKNATNAPYLTKLCSAAILPLYTSVKYVHDWNTIKERPKGKIMAK